MSGRMARCSHVLHSAATAACVLLSELRELSFNEGLYGVSDGPKIPTVIDLDSDLVESHQRS